MGNHKKFLYIITILISFIFIKEVNAANEGDVFNVGINGSTLRTTNSLYIDQGNVTFNLSNTYVYSDVTLVPQYGVVSYCSGVGKQIENFYGTNISNVSLYNTGMPCSVYGKEDGYSNEQLVYVTFTLAYSSGIASGVNCSANLTNCYFSGMSFTIYNPSTDEISLKQAYLTNTLPNIQMNPNGSVLRDIASQNDAIINNGNATNNKLDEQIEQNKEIINKQNETNEKLDEVNDSLTSEEAPNVDGLSNDAIVGWLPAGPIDSILNLPLSMMTNLSNSIGSTCEPVDLPLPYVDKTLTLPCLSNIYSQIDGLSAFLNTIGTIVSAFILYSYFMKLYKWVDDTLTFRENNHIDNWGGL